MKPPTVLFIIAGVLVLVALLAAWRNVGVGWLSIIVVGALAVLVAIVGGVWWFFAH
jgi:hypothetical protein